MNQRVGESAGTSIHRELKLKLAIFSKCLIQVCVYFCCFASKFVYQITLHCLFCYGQPEINLSHECLQCELNVLSVHSHRLYLNKGPKGLFQC